MAQPAPVTCSSYPACADVAPEAVDCFNHMEKDGKMCDDRNPKTAKDECYQGACGSWVTIQTTVATEAERLAWAKSTGDVAPAYKATCWECTPLGQPSSPANGVSLPHMHTSAGAGGAGAWGRLAGWCLRLRACVVTCVRLSGLPEVPCAVAEERPRPRPGCHQQGRA